MALCLHAQGAKNTCLFDFQLFNFSGHFWAAQTLTFDFIWLYQRSVRILHILGYQLFGYGHRLLYELYIIFPLHWILVPSLLTIAIDWITHHHMFHKQRVYVGNRQFTDLVYADDTTAPDAADCLSSFNRLSLTLCRLVSSAKTKIRNWCFGSQLSYITVDSSTVEQVEKFVYLSIFYSYDERSQPGKKLHVVLATSVMSSLQRIWSDRYLSLSTKAWAYRTLVLHVLAYACETWTLSATKASGGISYKMPTPNNQNPLAGPYTQHKGRYFNWPQSCIRVHHRAP